MIACADWGTRIFCFVCIALCNVKNGAAMVYTAEVVGAKNAKFAQLCINVFDRSTLFILGFLVIFLSRWWLVITGTYVLVGLSTWFVIYNLMPESPNWLMMNNRREEAIASLNLIAEMNGVEERIPENATFKEMQPAAKDEVIEEEFDDTYSFVSNAEGLSAASFDIQIHPNQEQKESEHFIIPMTA